MCVNPSKSPLKPSRSVVGRFAVYASILVTALIAWLMLAGLRRSLSIDPGWKNRDFTQLEEVDLLQRFLQIDTTAATGSEIEGAEFLAAILRAEGVPVEILDMENGKANLIAILEGDEPERLILHSHLDLDPVRSPELWNTPPFGGTIEAPWIYGRGAFDMKSVTIAQVLGIVDLKRRGIRPRRTITFLATSSEEVDSELGTLWLLRHRPEIFENTWAVLTEGGVLEARGIDDIKYWGTEFSQKRYVKVIACSQSRQSLEDLRRAILRRGQSLEPLRLTPGVATFLDAYASTRDHPRHRELLGAPHELIRDLQSFEGLPTYLQGLFRDEIHPFSVIESPEGSGYQMRITLALLEDTEIEEAIHRLLPSWMTAGLELNTIVEPSATGGSDPDHEVLRIIDQALKNRFGVIQSGPYFQGRSATDARFFRASGIPAYGFTPFLALTTDTLSIGGPNEGIALPAFIEGVALYKELVSLLVADGR